MKKFKQIILILLIACICIKVQATELIPFNLENLNKQSDCLNEEITPLFDSNNNLYQLDIKITIEKNCDEEQLIISPSIIGAIKEYKNILPNDNIKINLKVINNSNNNYKYTNNSLIISTENLTRLGVEDNFIETNAIGFDNQKIYDLSTIYRTINNPIKSLYNYKNKITEKDLTNNSLDKILKEKNYSGIEDLDKYYLDYYNTKYNLKETSLENFTTSTIKDLFQGEKTSIKETNKNIISLSYNYFYDKILTLNFKEDNEEYSIKNLMITNLGEKYIKEKFKYLRKNTYSEIENIKVILNENYYTEAFTDYYFDMHLEFSLNKTTEEEVLKEEGLIIPPNTGI